MKAWRWTFGDEPLARRRRSWPRPCGGSPRSRCRSKPPSRGARRAARRARRGRASSSRGWCPPTRRRASAPRPTVTAACTSTTRATSARSTPCFPEYDDHGRRRSRASGTVTFPIVYEGPPGIVHGGFLAVFFDSVMQHHNCDVGVAGKTTAMAGALPAAHAAADRARVRHHPGRRRRSHRVRRARCSAPARC